MGVQEGAGPSKRNRAGTSLGETLPLERFTDGQTRMEAARHFYDMLVLQGKGHIELQQDAAYGPMTITVLAQQHSE